MTQPLVSVGIPTFNRSASLRRAIKSALNQTFVDLEVIVSDNCSNDNTQEVLAEFSDHRLRSIRQESNIGMVPNWNACLSNAHGRFFVLLSDDDELYPNALERLLLLGTSDEEIPRVGLVDTLDMRYGKKVPAVTSTDIGSGKCSGFDLFGETIKQDKRISVMFCAVLFPVSRLRSYGGFPEDFPFCADVVPLIRMLAHGDAYFLNEACALYAIQKKSATLTCGLSSVLSDQLKRCDLATCEVSSAKADREKKKRLLDLIRVFRVTEIQWMVIHYILSGLNKIDALRCAWRWRNDLLKPGKLVYLCAAFVLPRRIFVLVQNLKRGVGA